MRRSRSAAAHDRKPKPTLPATLKCGNRAKSWNTMPTLRASGGEAAPGRATTSPPRRISPRASGSNPAMARSRLVLPQPLGPSRQPMVPFCSDSVTSRTTGSPR